MSQEETTPVADNIEAPETETPGAAESSMETQLVAAQKEAQDNLEARLRLLAEFQNYKRRIERELSESAQKAAVDVLTKLLPIIDDFERGMTGIPEELNGNPWLNGITLIQRKFQKLLDEYEVVIIDPLGEMFDPSRHEAVGVEENSEVASGHVAVTLQKGYLYKERVLRPAMVRVAG